MLMLLSVSRVSACSGLGIVIWPVLMILIVTTIDVYLAMYKGLDLIEPDERAVRRNWLPRKRARDVEPISSDSA